MEESAISRVLRKVNSSQLRERSQEDLQKSKEKKLMQVSYKCEKCKDTGWILKNQEHGQPIATSCECRLKNKVKTQWKSSGINSEMIDYKFASFEVCNENAQIMKDTALAYYNDFDEIRKSRKNSILFCGQVGSGKTHISIAIALNLIKSNVKVVYMPYRDVVTKIKQNITDMKYYKKNISKYQNCEVLLIDDLFKGKVNESDVNIIFEIINYRYLNMLPIIVSSEFTINKLLEFDQGVGSRIFEMCKDYMVEIEQDIKLNYRLR